MKKLVLAAILTITIVGCKAPAHQLVANTVFTGRIVNGLCGFVTILVIGSKSLGETGWSDAADKSHKVFDYVFRLGNPCSAGLIAAVGDTFRFQVIEPHAEDCTQCMAFANTPATTYSIVVVR